MIPTPSPGQDVGSVQVWSLVISGSRDSSRHFSAALRSSMARAQWYASNIVNRLLAEGVVELLEVFLGQRRVPCPWQC